MITVAHVAGKGWRLSNSCLTFGCYEDAVAYAAALDPDAAAEMLASLKCEACSSKKEVLPEPCGITFLFCCKACRACPGTATAGADHLGKVAKKAHVVHELSREEWIESTRREVRRFNLKTTGVLSLDEAMRLAEAPKRQRFVVRDVVDADCAPTGCAVCGGDLDGSFVDGVVKHSGWAYMHPDCHKSDGIGFGTGRGYLYVQIGDGSYRLAPEKLKPEAPADATNL